MSSPLPAITFRLNGQVEADRNIHRRYFDTPRARRQEWLRMVVSLGMSVLDGSLDSTANVAVKAVVAAAPEPVKVTRSVDTRRNVEKPAAADQPTPVVSSAEALKGFFGSDA